MRRGINALSVNLTKWSSTLKQFVGNLPTNCLSVFDHFVKLALKGLRLSPQNDFIQQNQTFSVHRLKSYTWFRDSRFISQKQSIIIRTVFDERLYIDMNMLCHKRHKCSTEKLVKKLRQISKACQFRKYKLCHGCFPGNLSEIVTLFLKTLWSHFKGINERYQGNEFNYMQQNWSSVLDENIYIRCPISISIFWKGNESDFHTCFYSF